MSTGTSATPLGKVRGLGPSGNGGAHWIEERFAAVALVPLSLWLIFSLIMLPDMAQRTLAEWLRAPSAAVPMALFIVAAFKHALDGTKVLIDDYAHDEGNRVGLHYVSAGAALVGAALSLFALAKIAFGAA